MDTLSENSKKKLKLFIKTTMNKTKELNIRVDFDGYSGEYYIDDCYDDNGHRVPDILDIINEVLSEIINDNDLIGESGNHMEERDGRGYLEVNIDCIERKISISGYEYVWGTNELFFSDNSLPDEVLSFMDNLIDNGYSDGYVNFDGSDDDGYIEDIMKFDDGNEIELTEEINNYLYDFLESSYGGWEINEGSSGTFTFHLEDKEVVISLNENVEDIEGFGKVFYSEF